MDDFASIILEDEEGNEIEVEIIDTLEHEGKVYVAMVEVVNDPQELLDSSDEYYIFELIDDEEGQGFAPIDDEALLDTLSQKFEELFDSYDEE